MFWTLGDRGSGIALNIGWVGIGGSRIAPDVFYGAIGDRA